MGGVEFPNMQRVEKLWLHSTTMAVDEITSYLEDTSEQHQFIYFDGWDGLGASVVLKSIAEDPPLSLRSRFDNIIHIDCSRWKNRRELQRTIAQKLRLGQDVMAIFDRQDEDDDFGGLDDGSRVEIRDVVRKTHHALQGQTCLVLFHNGSNSTIDLNDFGIPLYKWSNGKVLWTYRGRLRVIPGMAAELQHGIPNKRFDSNQQPQTQEMDNSHLFLYSSLFYHFNFDEILHQEATEIAQYMKLGITLEIVAECLKYVLLVNWVGDNLDFDWATHASNYWVCDGIIQERHQDKAWEVAAAVQEEIRPEDSSYHRLEMHHFVRQSLRWIVATNSYHRLEPVPTVQPWTTSFFLAARRGQDPLTSLPANIFQGSEQLHVLKLCHCTFRFSSPPFLHCRSLRFLGLDSCKNETNKLEENRGEEDNNDARNMDFFQNLWVLDICDTDWELDLSPDIVEKAAINIREINIKRGRIWHNSHAWTWRHLQSIHKLRVIEPTCPWETGNMDEFRDMVKLELLDLSGNSTIQVLPSLSGSTGLSTLVLDGCVELEHVGPEALPLSLKTFSFDAGARKDHDKEAKMSRICMAGCARLVNFKLSGSLPNLEDLDLSDTSIKTLDLKDVVQVPCLERIMLLGCERLRAILWPKDGMPQLMLLCIDTRGGTEAPRDSLVINQQPDEYGRASVYVTDMRFLQSLVLASGKSFFWNNARFNMSLCFYSTSKGDGQKYSKKKMGPYSTGQLVGSPLHKSLIIPKSYQTYSDVNFDKATIDHDGSSAQQFQPLGLHVEIGEGISNINVVTEQRIGAVSIFVDRVQSLHVHDNVSITSVIPESMSTNARWSSLKWCCIERCLKLDVVFTTIGHAQFFFPELETFWAADLLMTRCIWSEGSSYGGCFAKLRAIHLHFCPRLAFVLPLQFYYTMSSLETLHIAYCGDLCLVFPGETSLGDEFKFSELKHVYLHDLPKLQLICGGKMFAPKLETIWVRGCWSLKRLPATANNRPDGRPVVDCEKDWWEKLEWDGKEARHHRSLFEPRHSRYYKKKNLLRGTVLR